MVHSFLSARLDVIKPSATLAVNARAMALKAEGKDIISLGVGEPDFDTPDFIKEAAFEAIKSGQTKYTPVDGTASLKQAIVEKFKKDNGLSYTKEQITVANGGKQVLYNALMATLNPGDEVIIPAPYWTSYPEMVLMSQGTPVIVQCTGASRFKMKPEQLEAAITPKTKWLILNSPSNPTGVAYSQEELKALGEVLKQHPHVYVMVDDIYEHLCYDGFVFKTLAQVVPELYERVLTINGVSKSHAMTGWRIGFAGGPVPLIKAMGVIQSQSTSNPCSISQAAAVAALTGDASFLINWRKTFEERRNFMVEKLNKIKGITCLSPEGAFYVFPDISSFLGRKTPAGSLLKTESDFATYLLEEALVAGVPGEAFGAPGHIRFSYALSLETIEKAMERITAACEKIS